MRARHMIRRFFQVAFLSIALASCATSPTGRKQILLLPDDQMSLMGTKSFEELKVKTPIEHDSATNVYVKCVARAITNAINFGSQPTSWEVVVFKDPQVNAFALPGGKIGVYEGLLKVANSPAQLGTVLGHEVGHVLARHGDERVSQQMGTELAVNTAGAIIGNGTTKSNLLMAALGVGAQYGILLPFSRTQESEADLMDLTLMAQAGFDPQEAIKLWQNMSQSAAKQPPEFLSDHPANENRIAKLQENMPAALEAYSNAPGHPDCRM